VYARVFDVKIDTTGRKQTLNEESSNASISAKKHHRVASKIRFYWEGQTQKREWVVNDKKDDAETDDFTEERRALLPMQIVG
jgi:hypothetical protein